MAQLAQYETKTPAAGILSEAELIEKVIAELHEVISGLESRLTPVTRPMPCNPPEVDSPSKETDRSGLMDKLQRHRSTIQGAVRRISELHGRVDL